MFKAEFTCVKDFCRGPQVKARWKGRFFFKVIFPGNILMNFIQGPVKIEHCSEGVAVGGFVGSKTRMEPFAACWLYI